MYIPFARKYRPKTFEEVVGQEGVKTVLKTAVKTGKVHHAYLFAGPRGTGKTTIARILTKALNCLNPKDGDPCNACENCLSIDKGNFPDLIEIDAASNRGIEDIRAIRDAVSYAPIKGKYKVYILDEAHMLTKEAFNALLKTLEEPPPKTVFVLCTTEYDKILPTILSRCQRFIFSKLRNDEIVYQLEKICKAEGIDYEKEALYIIAMVSDGGMRDAVSLLDQASIYGEGKITQEKLEEFLGIPSQAKVREFINMLIEARKDDAIKTLQSMYHSGINLQRFWDMLEEEIRSLLLYKSLTKPEDIIEVDEFHKHFDGVPLTKILYLEKVVNQARADARTRDFYRACQLAIIKTELIKDIMDLTELLSSGYVRTKEAQAKEEERTPEFAIKVVEEKVGSSQAQILKKLKAQVKDDKVIFVGSAEDLKSLDIDKIKNLLAWVDFEEEVSDFTKQVKDIFGAKIIKKKEG
ncbi:DNA polymerase III subunit gamma/tau [Thermocrinis minervae]|uniref:DNA polymerase III subunit gamma/tau n=1 Tax=Thermocrinis minervae TaxID=381751 RepID=A0A1M6QT44_9AQUI|nr:DNA polymerase III subunit gamma/tau [Thermocrinis minervae]SHK23197.1 DNA polymerase-3 subunit gamma/tau [Thermocrinis minervae]